MKYVFCIFLLLCVVFSPLLANKAHAQWAVFDVPNTVVGTVTSINTSAITIKEYILDTVVYLLINSIIDRISAATVAWINNGFQGSPAFVTNPEKFFTNIVDGVAGQLIYANPNFQYMCAPFRLKVQVALNQAYNKPYGNFQCTLSGVINNWDNFMNDFNQGGWDGFIQMTQNSQNNPIGLYTQWQGQFQQTASNKVETQGKQLSWGQGFLTKTKCANGSDPLAEDEPPITEGEQWAYDLGETTELRTPLTKGQCTDGSNPEATTPGTVIEKQLNNVLNIGNGRIQVADEVNEIIGAVLQQVTNKIVGGIGAGLRSLSSSGSGNNGKAFTQDLLGEADDQETKAGGLNQSAGSTQFGCITPDGKAGTRPTPDAPCTASSTTEGNTNSSSSGGTYDCVVSSNSSLSPFGKKDATGACKPVIERCSEGLGQGGLILPGNNSCVLFCTVPNTPNDDPTGLEINGTCQDVLPSLGLQGLRGTSQDAAIGNNPRSAPQGVPNPMSFPYTTADGSIITTEPTGPACTDNWRTVFINAEAFAAASDGRVTIASFVNSLGCKPTP